MKASRGCVMAGVIQASAHSRQTNTRCPTAASMWGSKRNRRAKAAWVGMRPRRARLGLGTPDPPLKGWQDGRARDITKIGETTDERRAPATIDLSPLMPPPVQQELSSCVSRALGYGCGTTTPRSSVRPSRAIPSTRRARPSLIRSRRLAVQRAAQADGRVLQEPRQQRADRHNLSDEQLLAHQSGRSDQQDLRFRRDVEGGSPRTSSQSRTPAASNPIVTSRSPRPISTRLSSRWPRATRSSSA